MYLLNMQEVDNMFKIGNRHIMQDTPFEHNGVRYPANWLRLSTPEEKAALGLIEVPDILPMDRRFYRPLDAEGINNGLPIPRELETVKEEQIATVKLNVRTMLTNTDWAIIRQVETGQPLPNNIQDYRSSVRVAGQNQIERIKSAEDIESLKDVVTSILWPDRSHL